MRFGMIKVMNKRSFKSNTCVDVYIGRPSVLGNPFRITGKVTRKECIEAYRGWIHERINDADEEVLRELERIRNLVKKYGRVNLVCWCAPLPCHGDVIKEYLDSD